jgi:hypothetical protein
MKRDSYDYPENLAKEADLAFLLPKAELGECSYRKINIIIMQ